MIELRLNTFDDINLLVTLIKAEIWSSFLSSVKYISTFLLMHLLMNLENI